MSHALLLGLGKPQVVTVSLSPTALSGSRLGAGAVTTSTPNGGFCDCSVSPTGGTFSWRRISGDSTVEPTLATSQSSKFSTTVAIAETKEATFVCDYTYNGQVYTSSNGVLATLSEAS